MLRINLLPAYVAQRRLNKQLIFAYVTLFTAVVVLLLLYQYAYLTPADVAEATLANNAVDAYNYITNENTTAASTTATVAPIQSYIDFVNAISTYNTNYPNLYENVARFTSPKILYYGMTVSGSTLTINAYAPSIEALNRYLQIMYHEPDFNTVTISAIPTPDQAAQKIYYYKGVVIGESNGATTKANANSLPGVPSTVNVTLPAALRLNANQAGAGNAGRAPLPPGFSASNRNETPADVYAIIDSDPNFNPKFFKIKTRRLDGFDFTVTCALKTTFTPPVPPTVPIVAAAAPTAPGAAATPVARAAGAVNPATTNN